MRRIFCGLLLLTALAGPAFAGPAGGPAGSPVLNQSQRQTGATFNVSSATVDDLFTKKIHFSDLTISTSAIGTGASNIILNQSILQSGATFYVSSGTVAGNLRAGSFYGDGSNLTGIGATLPTNSTSYIQNRGTLQSGATFYVSSGTVAGTLTAGTFAGSGSGLTSVPAASLTGSVPTANLSNSILNQGTLQSGAMFYVSSGTVSGPLYISGNLFPQRLGYGTSTPASIIDLNGNASDPSPMVRMGTISNGDVLNLQANGLGTVLTAQNIGSGPSAVFSSNSTTIKTEGSTGDPTLTLDDNNGSPGSAIKFSYSGTPYAQIGAGTDRSLSILSSTDSTVSPTERVYFSNDSTTNGLIRFNTNNKGFNLAQSSLTFITGGTSPILDWANTGKLTVTNAALDVSTVNVHKAIVFGDGTTQTTALTGGGASSLAVFLGGTQVSSPTLKINLSSAVFTANESPTGTSNVALNASSVTLQGNLFNTGSTALVQLSGGLIPNSLVDGSSVTKAGNTFNTGVNLVQLSGGLIPNSLIDASSVTKQGVLIAGSNVTLTPGAGTLTINSTGGGGGGSSTLSVGTGTVSNYTTQVTSPTAVLSFLGSQFGSLAGGSTNFISLIGSGLPAGSGNYIQNTNTLQSGATFYVSSGTVAGNLTAGAFYGDGSHLTGVNTSSGSSVTSSYGSIYLSSGSMTQSSNGTPAKITVFDTIGDFSGTVPSTTNAKITISTAGVYNLFANFVSTGITPTTSTIKVYFDLRVNGVSSGFTCEMAVSNGAKCDMAGVKILSVSDVVELYTFSTTPVSMIASDAQLVISAVGGAGGGSGSGTITNVNGGYGISTTVTGSTTTVNLLTNSTSYIQNTSTLQSGATFYVSSGTVAGQLTAGTFFYQGATDQGDGVSGPINLKLPLSGSTAENIDINGLAGPSGGNINWRQCVFGTCGNLQSLGVAQSLTGSGSSLFVTDSGGNTEAEFTTGRLSIPSALSMHISTFAYTSNLTLTQGGTELTTLYDATAGSITITLPQISYFSIPRNFNRIYVFQKIDSSVNPIVIQDSVGTEIARLRFNNHAMTLQADGYGDFTGWHVIGESNPNTIWNTGTIQSGATFYVSSGSVAGQLSVNSIKWPNGTIQVSSPTAGGGSGTVTSVTAGYGLSGGAITTAGTISLITNSTSYIQNTSTLQSGSTAYPDFLYVGTSETVKGNFEATGTTKLGTLAGVLKGTAGTVSGAATTSDLPEGTNLYFTTARATTTISASAPVLYSAGVISIDKSSVTLQGTLSAAAPITLTGGVFGIDGSFISTTTAASTYLTQSSATATYLQLSSATATYDKKTDSIAASRIAAGSLGASVLASSFPVTGASAGSYTLANITVNAQGLITAASNGSATGSVAGSTGTIGISIDGGGSAIVAGSTRSVTVPYACTISSWTFVADAAGSISVHISSSTYSDYPTLYSISGSGPPLLSSAQKNSAAPTGWATTTIPQGTIISFVVDSAATVKWANLILWCIKS